MASARPFDPSGGLDGEAGGSLWAARFDGFGGPCEILMRPTLRGAAREAVRAAHVEAMRIQARFSRYRDESWLGRLHAAGGDWVDTDDEIEALLALGDQAHRLSGGRFDLSSGVLRRAWTFAPGARPPRPAQVRALLALVGWERVERDPAGRRLRLPAGMELDLGGLGKEYAVDRAAGLLAERLATPWLVNFGGDVRAGGGDGSDEAWRVGVDDPADTGRSAVGGLGLRTGALATSGDARRHILHRGRRLGHILDARTGWPPPGAPASVTVQADTCSLAGLLSTLAILQGRQAEAWLGAQGLPHWILR